MIIKPPKIIFDNRFGQVIFTARETIKLIFKISPGYLFLVLFLNTFWGISVIPAFYLDKLILDRIVANLGNPLWQEVLRGIGLLVTFRVVLEIIRNLLSRVTTFLRRTLTGIFSAGMQVMIGEKISTLDIATIENIEFKNRFNKIEEESGERSWGLMMPLSNIPNYISGFLGTVGLLILLSPLIAVAVFILSLPQFFVDSKFIKREYQMRTAFSPLYRLWGWLSMALIKNRNFLEFKILNLSPVFIKKLKGVQKEIIDQEVELSKSKEVYHSLVYLPAAIMEGGLYIWLISLALVQKITIGSLQLYLNAFRSTQMNLMGLVSSILEIYENYLYIVDLIWFLNLRPVIAPRANAKKMSDEQEEIRFEHVWFRYREDTPWILKDINLTIKPGERLAIVGENGSGKSTLIKLLARFYDPQKGDVYIGKENLKDINVGEWHNRLAILFQKFEGYPFTARESIGYGDTNDLANLRGIKEAAHKTGMDTFIETLPLKYENPLAVDFEEGIDLSIGQWQRMGLSRMLFRRKAKVIILDEPTSNVDPKAEEEIFQNLTRKAQNKTLIFISQRFSTVRLADQISVIGKGTILENGTHQELMKQKGIYAELFNLQAKGYQ